MVERGSKLDTMRNTSDEINRKVKFVLGSLIACAATGGGRYVFIGPSYGQSDGTFVDTDVAMPSTLAKGVRHV